MNDLIGGRGGFLVIISSITAQIIECREGMHVRYVILKLHRYLKEKIEFRMRPKS